MTQSIDEKIRAKARQEVKEEVSKWIKAMPHPRNWMSSDNTQYIHYEKKDWEGRPARVTWGTVLEDMEKLLVQKIAPDREQAAVDKFLKDFEAFGEQLEELNGRVDNVESC